MNEILDALHWIAHVGAIVGKWTLVVMVMTGAIPLLAATYQFGLIGFHPRRDHYDEVAIHLPRIAILIPAWNEAAVIGGSIDRLVHLDYPAERLKVFVVDDASTDDTPDIVLAKAVEYPGRVVHFRRENGGQGKAHTLNHGLRILLDDDWAEAVLIMDADVIYQPDSLWKMARHLADPEVGAVTAYIEEGSHPGNWMTRFIAFEYITAQAAARRSQNVLGALACLAGGAQLHTRENLEGIGGQIDTSSLAEDTFTTFKTQLRGKRVVFDGNARVLAEEPCDIIGLWKQRLRWARGNVQVSLRFKHIWFRPSASRRLGSFSFGLFWFCLFLLPVFMIMASVGLVSLFFIDFPLSWKLFHLLWITNLVTFVFITVFSFLIDPPNARRSWKEGILFPGLISVLIILYTCAPRALTWLILHGLDVLDLNTRFGRRSVVLFAYVWLAGTMLVAWLAKTVEPKRFGRWLSPLLVYIAGYGPLLCAVTFTSYVKEARGAEMKWDKTEKTGKIAA